MYLYHAQCDFDTFYSDDNDAIEAHFAANPTHTGYLGARGTAIIPAHYGTAIGVPQKSLTGFTVPANVQTLFAMDLDFSLSAADLIINGMLIGVR